MISYSLLFDNEILFKSTLRNDFFMRAFDAVHKKFDKIDKYCIVMMIGNTEYNRFKIKHNKKNGVLLVNNVEKIKISTLNYQFELYNSLFLTNTNTNTNINTDTTDINCVSNCNSTKYDFISKDTDSHLAQKKWNKSVDSDMLDYSMFNIKKEQLTKEKYLSDKHTYFLIKTDIDAGIIDENSINPNFAEKYVAFDFLSDSEIIVDGEITDDELEKYNEIYLRVLDAQNNIE
jgi:hypothetical protein